MKISHLLSCLALTLAAPLALALDIKPYSAEALALAQAQAAGKPVALHFHADWCPTCKQQEKALAQLKAEPGLDTTVLVVNYDNEKDLRRALKVRTQSTFIVYKGKDEKVRLAGDTEVDKIRAALKAAL